MNLTDLIRQTGYLTRRTWAPSDLEHRARRLREAGMLPTGAGRRAADVGPEHAAALFVALAASERATDAAQTAPRYMAMRPVGGLRDSFAGATTFGEAFAAVLEDWRDRFGVERIVVCRTWPEAAVTWRRGGEERTAVYRPEDTPAFGYGDALRVDVTFSGGLLHQIAAELRPAEDKPEDAGWSDDETGKRAKAAFAADSRARKRRGKAAKR